MTVCTSLKFQWAGSTFSLFPTSAQLVILQRVSIDFKGIHGAPEKHNTVCECECTQMRILLGRWEEAAMEGQMALCPLKLKNHGDKRNSLTKKKLNLGYWAPALFTMWRTSLRLGFLIAKMKMTPASQIGDD